MIDNYRHKGLRRRLLGVLERKGIRDQRVLDAIGKIPRHLFLDKAFEEKAYEDIPFPIDREQTISQPYTVAFQTELLSLTTGDKVLEIGTGSGYQACVLAEILDEVYTIERHYPLYLNSIKVFESLGYENVHAIYGDGYLGLPDKAPFDKILLTAAADNIPSDLVEQLAVGGFLVMPLGRADGVQTMLRLHKQVDGSLRSEKYGSFRFVPMVQGTED